MNANELRVGNWYSQFGNLHQVTWDTIKALGDAPETQLWCKPIPLSPEILEKCGLVSKDDDGGWRHNNCETFELEENYLSMDGFAFVWDAAYAGINVTSLHQLQNLYYALTGEELTYKQ